MADDPFNLKQLPNDPAPEGLWPVIARRLDASAAQPARTRRPWAALAAGVLLAVALATVSLRVADGPITTQQAGTGDPPTGPTADDQLQRWQQLSAEFEQRLAANRGGIIRAADLAELSFMTAELRLTDELLAERPDSPALWRQRAELLGEMAERYQAGNWQQQIRLASY